MREHEFSSGSTLKINLMMLQAFLSGVVAWWLWPDKLIDWVWGFLSIILWASCVGSATRALAEMYSAYRRDKKIETMMAMGSQPKSSAVVPDDALDKAGMR